MNNKRTKRKSRFGNPANRKAHEQVRATPSRHILYDDDDEEYQVIDVECSDNIIGGKRLERLLRELLMEDD